MLASTSGFFFLLTFAFGAAQSYADNRWIPYTNLYGRTSFNTSPTQNLIGTMMGSAGFLLENDQYLSQAVPNMTPQPNSFYDFIVVGAGTAGATVAARLAEIPEVEVLLVEAGGDESLFMDIPVIALFLQPVGDINWMYRTEPSDKYCMAMTDRRCKWPRGKVMGGSSVLNFMIATRGSPSDFDRWAEMGNDGWAFKDVLKYFKKLEDMQIPELRGDKKYHGTGGPVAISYAPYHTPLADAFLRAGQELGYPLVNYNGKNMIGFSYIQSTTSKGLRWSSNRAYLHGRRRRNLHVSKSSMVSKVIIDEQSKRALGVEFIKNGRRMSVYARREVILCAGAIGTPQILMLSGIGPAKHLQDLGIKVMKDSPVGDNLMDHIAYGGLEFTVNQSVSLAVSNLVDISKPYISDYVLNRKGPITAPGGCEALAFLDIDNPKKRDGLPNMELLFIGDRVMSNSIMLDDMGIDPNMRRELVNDPRNGWKVFPMLLRPKSRGWIRLKSKSIFTKPAIVANYLDHPEDIRILIGGIRATLKLLDTEPMKQFGSQLYNVTFNACKGYKFDSDDYWLCLIRMITFNIYHYSGTCKMGRSNDPTAVVDPTLKVIGIKALRVADASIMPEIISAHPNIPVFMIAEKLADMVKQEWGYPTN